MKCDCCGNEVGFVTRYGTLHLCNKCAELADFTYDTAIPEGEV
jgi:hypothetical protein